MNNLIPQNCKIVGCTVYAKDYDILDDNIKWCIQMGIYDLHIIKGGIEDGK